MDVTAYHHGYPSMVVEGEFNHVLGILVIIMEHVKLMEKIMCAIVVQVSCRTTFEYNRVMFLVGAMVSGSKNEWNVEILLLLLYS